MADLECSCNSHAMACHDGMRLEFLDVDWQVTLASACHAFDNRVVGQPDHTHKYWQPPDTASAALPLPYVS